MRGLLFSGIVALIAQVLPVPASVPPDQALTIAQATALSGSKKAVVCGDVQPATGTDPTSAVTTIVLADARSDILSVVIQKGDRQKFSEGFERLLVGRKFCVDGTVEHPNHRTQLKLKDARQVRFVGQPARSPSFRGQTVIPDGRTVSYPQPLTQSNPK